MKIIILIIGIIICILLISGCASKGKKILNEYDKCLLEVQKNYNDFQECYLFEDNISCVLDYQDCVIWKNSTDSMCEICTEERYLEEQPIYNDCLDKFMEKKLFRIACAELLFEE